MIRLYLHANHTTIEKLNTYLRIGNYHVFYNWTVLKKLFLNVDFYQLTSKSKAIPD